MISQGSSYLIHIRTGFFQLDPYDMLLTPNGIHLYQTQGSRSVERVRLPNLEIQKVVVYLGTRLELEIITAREVFTGVLSKKTDIDQLQNDLKEQFGARVVVY
jgi:hypothetical protein